MLNAPKPKIVNAPAGLRWPEGRTVARRATSSASAPWATRFPPASSIPTPTATARYGARAGIAHHVGQQDLDADLSDTGAFISRR
jgi:hypothetical protein